ncbi:MAG: WD40 repeat domain-containing protein [Cyanobacteria bacterium J06641_5]
MPWTIPNRPISLRLRAILGTLGLVLLGSCQLLTPDTNAPPTATKKAAITVAPPTSPWQNARLIRSIAEAHRGPIRTIAIDPKGKNLATGSARAGKLWQLPEGEELVVIEERNTFDALAFSPDGEAVASGNYVGQIALFDMHDGRELIDIDAHDRIIFQVAFHPNNQYLASSSLELDVKLWDLQTQKVVRTFSVPTATEVVAITFSPDGRYLAGGDFNGGLWLWDAETGQLLRGYAGHRNPVHALEIGPEGKFLFSGSLDKTIKVWDLQTGQLRVTLRGHSEAISDIAISADGRTLASSSRDETIRLWDLRTNKTITTLEGTSFRQVAFTPDGALLIGAAEDGSLWFWEPG